jgi:hypothetical protein
MKPTIDKNGVSMCTLACPQVEKFCGPYYRCKLCHRPANDVTVCYPAVIAYKKRTEHLEGVVDGVCSALQQHPLGMSRTGHKTVVDVTKIFVEEITRLEKEMKK